MNNSDPGDQPKSQGKYRGTNIDFDMWTGLGTFDYFRSFKLIPDETDNPRYTKLCTTIFRLLARYKRIHLVDRQLGNAKTKWKFKA